MYKKYYTLCMLIASMTSCTADLESDIEALQVQNESIRNEIEMLVGGESTSDFVPSLGRQNGGLDSFTTDPLQMEHTYSVDGKSTFVDTRRFPFTSPEYQYMDQNSDGVTYSVEIYMWQDTDEDEAAYVDFTYNTETKEVLYLDYYLDYYNRYNDNIYINDNREDNEEESDTSALIVDKFDPVTGEISLTFTLDYTGKSFFSAYEQPGQITLKFDGKITPYYRSPFLEPVSN